MWRGEFILRKKLADDASNLFFHRESNGNQFRREQHFELDDHWGNQYFHLSRNVHFHVCKWLDQRESDRNDHLHANCHELRWVNHGSGDTHRERCGEADNQFIHCEPDKHHFRFQQHFGLDDHWGNQHFHHARDVHFHVCKWFHEYEPGCNDHLHADCDQHRWFCHRDSKSYGNRIRRLFVDNYHLMPRWHARRSLCRVHGRRQWRNSAV